MKLRSFLLCAASLALAVATIGCGKAQVTGHVYFNDGKSPLTCGVVNFTNGQIICKGEIDRETGEYRMRTQKPGDGVPPGTYKVYITEAINFGASGRTVKTGDASFDVIGSSQSLISNKYINPDESGLTITVKGSMKYDITLDDPPLDQPTEEK